MLESLNYSFRNPKKHNLSNLPNQTVEKLQQKKTMGSSEDPSLVNDVDELGLVYWGLNHVPQQHKTNARLLINAWSSRISLQTIMLAPFIKKLTAIYRTQNFTTMLDTSPLESERQQFRVPTLTIYFLKKTCISTLFSGFPIKILCAFLLCPMSSTLPSSLPDQLTRMILR